MKRAVVLLNLGGPDRPEAVEPYLFNLFNDRAVLRLPAPVRWPIARTIARLRAPTAARIYERLGGGSPLLANTEMQRCALQGRLGPETRVFIAMRHWHPFAEEAARAVKDWGAGEILLLPLYPQFSTTTTKSSLGDWHLASGRAGVRAATRVICCYPDEPLLVAAIAAEIRKIVRLWRGDGRRRILFSAHGLPERIARNDPYPWQVEQTAAAIRAALGSDLDGIDATLCYQSRIGPLKWLGPSIGDEIRRAGAQGVSLLVVPIAFVSEHSETLVELDVEFKHLAGEVGVPTYLRAPAVGTNEAFIAGLAGLVERGFAKGAPIASGNGGRLCPKGFAACPCRAA